MAKRTTIERDEPATGKEIRTPADQTVKNFNSAFDIARETVDDANDGDLRPRHLRQPGASAASTDAASVVQGLAEASGATIKSAEDPIVQIGRGPKNPKLN